LLALTDRKDPNPETLTETNITITVQFNVKVGVVVKLE
jgi:hypothetical protein